MKKNVSLMVMLGMVLAFGLVVVGCDDGSGGGGSDSGSNAISGTTWTAPAGFGRIYTLRFTSFSAYTLTYWDPGDASKTSTETGTYTVSGSTVTLTSAWPITQTIVGYLSGNTLDFTGMGGSFYTNAGQPTAITGTWTGTSHTGNLLTLTIGNTDWECVTSNGNSFKGTYTYAGTSGTFTTTHAKFSGSLQWVSASGTGTGTFVGNVLNVMFVITYSGGSLNEGATFIRLSS